MFRISIVLIWGLALETCAALAAAQTAGGGQPIAVESPDKLVRVEVSLNATVPQYRVTFKGRPVLLDSPLQIKLGDGAILGAHSVIDGSESRSIDEQYKQHPGKRSNVVNRCSEATISLHEQGAAPRKWQLVVRAYNDGAALRYRFPAQDGWSSLVIAGEQTVFRLPEDATAWALPLNSFTTPYEKRYQHKPITALPKQWLLGLPLLIELPGTGYAAITEANLNEYAGMYLAPQAGKANALISRLSPLPKEPAVAVRAALPHESPWRVVLLGAEVGRLIESDLVLNLNAPCAIADPSWIKPGKTTFPWWNGFYEENVPFKPGVNTATTKYYIDFCAANGIPYHSLDGLSDIAWYGGPTVPYRGADPTKAVEGLDMPEVLRYAKAKGVRLRVWMHWQAAQAHMARAFPLYHQWGLEGVMIDFMDRDDQEMLRFLRELVKTAADNQLTVTLHGMSKPTGLERTYPNLLNHEGVLNLEYDKWDPIGVPPEHDTTIPFTRMLAGPLDFHQGSFRTVAPADFKPRNDAPLIMGTPCRTLASYVILQNHLPMMADYPSAYRGHPALPTLVSIPTTWDDTKVLAGAVGQFIVIARRNGQDWWIGAWTDREARELKIPLDFLAAARMHAEIWHDDPSSQFKLAKATQIATAQDTIPAKLGPAGGLLIRLSLPADQQ